MNSTVLDEIYSQVVIRFSLPDEDTGDEKMIEKDVAKLIHGDKDYDFQVNFNPAVDNMTDFINDYVEQRRTLGEELGIKKGNDMTPSNIIIIAKHKYEENDIKKLIDKMKTADEENFLGGGKRKKKSKKLKNSKKKIRKKGKKGKRMKTRKRGKK